MKHDPFIHSLLVLTLITTLGLPGCAGDIERPDGNAQVLDQMGKQDTTIQPDSPVGPGDCTDGEKRCDGLTMVQICSGGKWVNHDDCSEKMFGSWPCNCSITLLYVCAYGANVCE